VAQRQVRSLGAVSSVHSFPPLAAPTARLLILGSMPGAASLAAGQYYAHPRNLFWPIMGALVGADPALPYAERVQRLKAARIAVWDVLASCVRPGSLDSAIVADSAEANDFPGFLADHPQVARVYFNGAAAERIFHRLVVPRIDARSLHLHRLPSTSPAHAARSLAQKLELWRVVIDDAGLSGH
jgi:double-stranded uracil-DNA glycosylase